MLRSRWVDFEGRIGLILIASDTRLKVTNAVFYFNGSVIVENSVIWVRVKITPELKQFFRHGCGQELVVSGNDHCMYLCIGEVLGLRCYTPLDIRRSTGAWMLLNQDATLPGGMTVLATIRAENKLTVEEYVCNRLDPKGEAHEDGRRNFPQGTLVDLQCCSRQDPPHPPPHPVLGEGSQSLRVGRQDARAVQCGTFAAG